MTDEEFLDKASKHEEYSRLLEYSTKEKLDASILRIKNGEGISETYYEYRFTVESDPMLNDRSQDFKDFIKDLDKVFDKYKDKGIIDDGMDSKGGSSPMALSIVRDVLKQES